MAGDERVMNEASLLMIHNAWTFASGNAAELRKQAEDLDKITQASVEAYKAHSSLSEDEIKALMDAETWILPNEALNYGFATSIEKTEKEKANQNAMLQLFNIIKAHQEAEDLDVPADDEEEEEETPETDVDDTNDDPEEPEDESEDTDDESEDNDEPENPAQRWSGFFNAFLNTERRM
jgi:ATP-dependent Clp protease protease subunit